MNSDFEIKQDLRSELDQEEPSNSKKKGLWQKIKEFFTQGSEDRDPSDW